MLGMVAQYIGRSEQKLYAPEITGDMILLNIVLTVKLLSRCVSRVFDVILHSQILLGISSKDEDDIPGKNHARFFWCVSPFGCKCNIS